MKRFFYIEIALDNSFITAFWCCSFCIIRCTVLISVFLVGKEKQSFRNIAEVFTAFSYVESPKLGVCPMIHNSRTSVIVYDLACILRMIQPITEPSQELPTLRICRNIPIDFFIEFVYNRSRSYQPLKLFGELDPSNWQHGGFFFCVIYTDISDILQRNCLCEKVFYVFFISRR